MESRRKSRKGSEVEIKAIKQRGGSDKRGKMKMGEQREAWRDEKKYKKKQQDD